MYLLLFVAQKNGLQKTEFETHDWVESRLKILVFKGYRHPKKYPQK